jgi:hypothetical protein
MRATIVPTSANSVTAGAKFAVKKLQNAVQHAANKVAKEIRIRGREDIAGAGNFGKRFISAFYSRRLRKTAGGTIVQVGSKIPFFSIFEMGGVVHGKPLLWIPIGDKALPRASSYTDTYDQKLVRITSRKGTPLLVTNPISADEPGELLYFGVHSVTIPKKFHIGSIVRGEVASIGGYLQTYTHELKE